MPSLTLKTGKRPSTPDFQIVAKNGQKQLSYGIMAQKQREVLLVYIHQVISVKGALKMSFGMSKPELIFSLEGREVRKGQVWHRVEKVMLNDLALPHLREQICLVITSGLGSGSHRLIDYDIAMLEMFWRNSRETVK